MCYKSITMVSYWVSVMSFIISMCLEFSLSHSSLPRAMLDLCKINNQGYWCELH